MNRLYNSLSNLGRPVPYGNMGYGTRIGNQLGRGIPAMPQYQQDPRMIQLMNQRLMAGRQQIPQQMPQNNQQLQQRMMQIMQMRQNQARPQQNQMRPPMNSGPPMGSILKRLGI